VNNGEWATNLTSTTATLSAKIVYEAVSPTEVTLYWGTTDGGNKPDAWQNSKSLGAQKAGQTCAAEIAGLKPWTTYYCRAAASNSKGAAWAGASIPFNTAGTLPEGWQAKYIGHEQRPGSGANFEDGAFVVRGSGRDIAEGREPIDNFQFAYRTLVGDGEIKARIAAAEVRSREPKIGVMLRETIEAGSKNVALLLLPRNGVRLSARSQVGGGSVSQMNASLKAAPVWLKLVRSGNAFTGFVSEDGAAWTSVGTPQTVEMGPKILAGLAVTSGSRDESKLHTSRFDQVSVSGETAAP